MTVGQSPTCSFSVSDGREVLFLSPFRAVLGAIHVQVTDRPSPDAPSLTQANNCANGLLFANICLRVAKAAHDPKQHRFEKSRKIRVSKVDQKGVFLERLFGAVVSIVTTMVTYQNVCAREDDRVQTLIGTQRGSTKKRRKRQCEQFSDRGFRGRWMTETMSKTI